MNWALYTQLNYAYPKPTNLVMNGIYEYPHRKLGLFTLWPLDVFVDEGLDFAIFFFLFDQCFCTVHGIWIMHIKANK